MANYRSYTHLEKLDKDVVKDILHCNHIIIQAKLDGSNACVWDAGDGTIACGSRKRNLSTTSDNGGFYNYINTSTDPEVEFLRNFCKDRPDYIVYGEFLGVPGQKLLGTIKDYVESGFFIFDVFDTSTGEYLPYATWSKFFENNYHRVVPLIADLDHIHCGITIESLIDAYADKTNFNMPDGMHGEGLVIKAEPSYRDIYGNIQIGKIVLDEFHARKKQKVKAPAMTADECINAFVENYCTAAFMAKEQNKVMLALGMDEWENKGKCIGMTIQGCLNELMQEEFWDYFKKHLVVLDLAALKYAIEVKVRKFLGLI
jgi:hypothetical protein